MIIFIPKLTVKYFFKSLLCLFIHFNNLHHWKHTNDFSMFSASSFKWRYFNCSRKWILPEWKNDYFRRIDICIQRTSNGMYHKIIQTYSHHSVISFLCYIMSVNQCNQCWIFYNNSTQSSNGKVCHVKVIRNLQQRKQVLLVFVPGTKWHYTYQRGSTK